MNKSWTEGLAKEDALALRVAIVESGPVLRRLIKILEKKMGVNTNASLGIEEYESPSWPLRQADRIGYNRSIRELIRLIDV